MAQIQERDIGKFLFNPFSVYVAGVGEDQPALPSFFTENAMTFTFNKEFVAAEAYNRDGGGVLYKVRQDLQRFDFNAQFSIKETTLISLQTAIGGTINSDNDEIVFDGSVSNFAFWFESCYNDDNKVIRIIVPQAKAIESSEFSTGDQHLMIPTNIQALPDLTDLSTLPSIFIEP